VKTALIAAAAAAAVTIAVSPAARADVKDAVNRVRTLECPSSVRAPLRGNVKLAQAAQRMAAGISLHQALSSAGYLAAQSSAVHLTGAVTDAQVEHILAADYCGRLTDLRLNEIGVQRQGRELWIILASPVSVPSVKDSGAISRQIVDLVNRARLTGRRCGGKAYPPAAPLIQNPLLVSAALAHSQDMAVNGGFDHRGHDGSSPAMRVERAGYGRYLVVGENIAAGAMTPAEVTAGWLESPAHCENIMDARFSEIGVGFAVNLASTELVYWTQVFAAPHSSRLSSERPR
jgi:uncharacterized protein YkwD